MSGDSHGHVESSGKKDGGFVADVKNAMLPDFQDLIVGSKGISSAAEASGADMQAGMHVITGVAEAFLGPMAEIKSSGGHSGGGDHGHGGH